MFVRGELQTQTAQAEAATRVVLLVFRANGLLLEAGDALAYDEGLTSARWQVLGAVAIAGMPLTVPQIARRMGLTRQSVHATVNRLQADGLVTRSSNADHRRSQLVDVTDRGAEAFAALATRQVGWSNRLAAGMELVDLETAARTLSQLCERLESSTHDHTS